MQGKYYTFITLMLVDYDYEINKIIIIIIKITIISVKLENVCYNTQSGAQVHNSI